MRLKRVKIAFESRLDLLQCESLYKAPFGSLAPLKRINAVLCVKFYLKDFNGNTFFKN
jgi:hypothetical protein